LIPESWLAALLIRPEARPDVVVVVEPASVFAESGVYPATRARLLGVGYSNGYAIASVAVYPFELSDGELYRYERIDVVVTTRAEDTAPVVRERFREGFHEDMRARLEKLVVNPNTVARAYRELESAGIVEKRRTAGTYVSDQGSPLARRERIKIVTERIDALLAEARQMGIAFDDLVKLMQQRGAALQTDRNEE